ncbi:MAG: hypothetical protein QUS09_08710 [Methanotrichaceae archaeon]|nr:hypothetical protein [Methanotrichaceae archaeon]
MERIESSSKENQEKIKAVLKRYVEGKIGLDEAYYELLDDELIPMPKRCGMQAKIPGQDEEDLKRMIRSKLSL